MKPHINYTNGAPEFKQWNVEGLIKMATEYYDDSFQTISEFEDCVIRGGEIEFEWKGKAYGVIYPEGKIYIGEGYYEKDGKAYNALNHELCPEPKGTWYDEVEDLLNHEVDGEKLRNIVTQLQIMNRTL